MLNVCALALLKEMVAVFMAFEYFLMGIFMLCVCRKSFFFCGRASRCIKNMKGLKNRLECGRPEGYITSMETHAVCYAYSMRRMYSIAYLCHDVLSMVIVGRPLYLEHFL